MKITIDVDFNAIKKGLRKEREESYRTLKKCGDKRYRSICSDVKFKSYTFKGYSRS